MSEQEKRRAREDLILNAARMIERFRRDPERLATRSDCDYLARVERALDLAERVVEVGGHACPECLSRKLLPVSAAWACAACGHRWPRVEVDP